MIFRVLVFSLSLAVANSFQSPISVSTRVAYSLRFAPVGVGVDADVDVDAAVRFKSERRRATEYFGHNDEGSIEGRTSEIASKIQDLGKEAEDILVELEANLVEIEKLPTKDFTEFASVTSEQMSSGTSVASNRAAQMNPEEKDWMVEQKVKKIVKETMNRPSANKAMFEEIAKSLVEEVIASSASKEELKTKELEDDLLVQANRFEEENISIESNLFTDELMPEPDVKPQLESTPKQLEDSNVSSKMTVSVTTEPDVEKITADEDLIAAISEAIEEQVVGKNTAETVATEIESAVVSPVEPLEEAEQEVSATVQKDSVDLVKDTKEEEKADIPLPDSIINEVDDEVPTLELIEEEEEVNIPLPVDKVDDEVPTLEAADAIVSQDMTPKEEKENEDDSKLAPSLDSASQTIQQGTKTDYYTVASRFYDPVTDKVRSAIQRKANAETRKRMNLSNAEETVDTVVAPPLTEVASALDLQEEEEEGEEKNKRVGITKRFLRRPRNLVFATATALILRRIVMSIIRSGML